MAYASLVSFAQTLDQIHNHGSYSIYQPEEEQFISVQKYVTMLQRFLEDFPEIAHSWDGRIRDVANEAEDTVEYLMWVRRRLHLERYGDLSHGRISYRFHGLEKVKENIESIVDQVMKIMTNLRMKKEQKFDDSPSATSSSRVPPAHKDVLIGFDDELIAVKARLCGESSHLQIIPIIGMGGIGKTTLARNAFDDPLIMEFFHICAWVTVSQAYSAQEILSSLLVSIEEFTNKKSGKGNECVEEQVYKRLKGRRYLIVIDDLWSTKAWEDLRMVLPNDGNGSRIMLTTRVSDIAAYPDPCTPLYEMHLMDVDKSWDLLRHKVFASQACPLELEDIGKEIARSCRGLPLAIVVIAGLLSVVSRTPASWGEIAENVNSTIATKDRDFDKILSLSYTHLPHHLRPCFLYMGGFPEDYEIRVSKLVKLWVAEGFLKRKNESKSLEDEAEEYVEDLVKRSLIIVGKRKSNGKIKSCSVHDLVRELCIRIAQEENFLLHAEKTIPDIMENQRRVSVSHFEEDCLTDINYSTIRTIKCFHCRGVAAGSLGKCQLLRVLVGVYTRFTCPTYDSINIYYQVSKLFHLKYLDLFHCNDLPEAISNLQNLQTLIIHAWKTSRDYPGQRACLPFEIWRIPQLRHLISYFFATFPNPDEEAFTLENLRTLSHNKL